MFLTIAIALFSLFFLLVSHEFGHFIMAKKFGVEVEEFGVGYPPRLFGRKFGETFYSFNLLPFGAFVKVKGEMGGAEDCRSFSGKKIWQRFLIILGGVVSFWAMAVVLLTLVAGIWGLPMAVADDDAYRLRNAHVQIVYIMPDSAAEKAGLAAGDAVIGFDKKIEFDRYLQEKSGQEITLNIKRGQEILEKKLTAGYLEGYEEKMLGISFTRVAFRTYPWYQAPLKGAFETWQMTGQIVSGWVMGLKNILGLASFPEGVKMEMLGPLGIFDLLRQYAGLGASYFLSLVSLISVALALANLLPIPALDGGKLVFLAVEFFKGSPVDRRLEQRITTVCYILLLALMVFVTFKFDIPRIF